MIDCGEFTDAAKIPETTGNQVMQKLTELEFSKELHIILYFEFLDKSVRTLKRWVRFL